MFQRLEEKLATDPELYAQSRIPNIINVVNGIRQIRSLFNEDNWQITRIQRNSMVHEFPHSRTLWDFAWVPLKRVIEPIGLTAQNLLATTPQILQQLDDLKMVFEFSS